MHIGLVTNMKIVFVCDNRHAEVAFSKEGCGMGLGVHKQQSMILAAHNFSDTTHQ
jgi:hypothetical protein